MTGKFTRGEIVYYRLHDNAHVEAIVRSVHRDGTLTVESRFVLDERGNSMPDRQGHVITKPPYLGYRRRIHPTGLSSNAPA